MVEWLDTTGLRVRFLPGVCVRKVPMFSPSFVGFLQVLRFPATVQRHVDWHSQIACIVSACALRWTGALFRV